MATKPRLLLLEAGDTLATVQAEFDAFVKKVAANGNMQKIVEGRSPVSDQPAEPAPR